MRFRYLKYTLSAAIFFIARASIASSLPAQATVRQQIFGPSSYTNNDHNRIPYIYFLGSNGGAQIYRTQNQRASSIFKVPFTYVARFSAYSKSLDLNFRRLSAGYLRSCKLILFPFHVFW